MGIYRKQTNLNRILQTNEKITELRNSTYNRQSYRTDKWQMRPPRRQHDSRFSEATCATAIRRYVADRMSDIGATLSRSAVPRDNDYNRKRLQHIVVVILSDNSTRCQPHPKMHTNFRSLLSLISPNHSPHIISWTSDKIGNKLAHIRHTPEVIICTLQPTVLAD